MNNQAHRIAVGFGLGLAFCTAAWLLIPPGPLRQTVVFVLAWIWPTATWAIWWNGATSERVVIAAGMGLMLNALLALAVTYIPGSTPAWALLLVVLTTAAAPLALMRFGISPGCAKRGSFGRDLALLLALLLLSLLLRLPDMGYKEFQGDEGIIMVRAATILTGDDSEWFNHQKGPIEILLPLVDWGIGATINDYWARLPFTWAGILSVAAIFWLGRRWFGPDVGLLAGLLFTVGGFGIAFSRIVQYQSLVMLWAALALLMASRYRTDGRWADLVMACSFLAAGTLAHYDALLAGPAVAWLLAGRFRAEERPRLTSWVVALTLAGLVVLLFYLPFVLSPNFARTFNYLLRDRVGVSGGTTQFATGFADGWRMMTFYNSIWYVLGLVLSMIVGLISLVRRRMGFAAVLYFAVPMVFYLFLVRDPRTHVYTIFPGAAIVAGVGINEAWQFIRGHFGNPGRVLVAGAGILWFAVVIAYPVLLFVDNSVERQRTWSENRPIPALYPATWQEPPQYGLFGFPHQVGWRAAGGLLPDSSLPYGSNEEEEITNWYMAQAPRTHCQDADSFLLVADAQDEVPYDAGWPGVGFAKQSEVLINGRPTMSIYRREGLSELVAVEGSDYDLWLTPAQARRPRHSGQTPVNQRIGSQIRLLGYDLDTTSARPGGEVTLTLYWQALTPIERNYQVFVHLYDGKLWAQHDGAPECGVNPTTRWEPGQIIADPHVVDLPTDIPLTSMPIVVGMYDLLTEERLPIEGSTDQALRLTGVMIGEG